MRDEPMALHAVTAPGHDSLSDDDDDDVCATAYPENIKETVAFKR